MGECPKCGGNILIDDDQFGNLWRDCYECGFHEKINNDVEEDDDEVCSCGGGGCVHCEPHRFIEGNIHI